MPKVSIVLPNLNNRRYLEERLRSIRNQTLEDWELVVVDSYSTDGAWEFFRDCAQQDKRIRIYSSKARGIYKNLNHCIKMAKGDYVYIAMSDDTMEDTLLEKLVAAMDFYGDCDLGHCKLKIIDDKDQLISNKWDDYFIVRYFGKAIDQLHIRRAPHDGVLHFSGVTVYTSLTQLLIRKRLFDRIGLFSERFGTVADYEWVMRATLIADTIHVPEALAAWRVHDHQATSDNGILRAKADGRFIKMADHALKIARRLNPDTVSALQVKKLKYILKKEKFNHQWGGAASAARKRWVLLKGLFQTPSLVMELRRSVRDNKLFLCQADVLSYIQNAIQKRHLEKNIEIIKSKPDE